MVRVRQLIELRPVYAILYILLYLVVSQGCAGSNKLRGGTAESHFEAGKEYFEKEKWLQAGEQFHWVVLNNPASDLAAEAQYHYAEALYNQDLYVEAQLEYERLLRRWSATDYLVKARYRIVQCLVAQSPKYFYEQSATEDALEEMQAFIDEFPSTVERVEAESLMVILRMKMAKKLYESGRLYLKWERGSSARLYFEQVLGGYYDTPYADDARLGIVIAYIVEEDFKGAMEYLEATANKFESSARREEAEHFIAVARQGKFDLGYFMHLYR